MEWAWITKILSENNRKAEPCVQLFFCLKFLYILKMKFIRNVLGFLLILLLLIELGLYVSGYGYINKLLQLTVLKGRSGPVINDLNEFPSTTVANGKIQEWMKSVRYAKLTLDSIQERSVDAYKTTALLVIQNDSILYEKYKDEGGIGVLSNSFSMAKSIQSILIGIALKKNLISSVNDPICKYLPELNPEKFKNIQIKHLLWMASGLDFNETYNSPFAWPAKAYYGNDVNATVLSPKVVEAPGTIFKYKGGDTQLLGMLLKKCCRSSVSEFASKELWSKIGSEFPAQWGTDMPDGIEKVSCCFYATARDFARLGKLMMQMGNWNGEQIIDSGFVKESIDPSMIKNTAGDRVDYYGYQWWLANFKGLQVIYARGILGQYIFYVPAKNLLIVRLGHLRASKTADEMPADAKLYLKIGFDFAD